MMMFIPILVLIAIMSRIGQGSPVLSERIGNTNAALLSLALVITPSILASALTALWVRALDRTGCWNIISRISRAHRLSQTACGIATAAAISWIGWLDVIRASIGDWILLDEILAAAPWALATAILASTSYIIDRRLRLAATIRELDSGQSVSRLVGLCPWIVIRLREVMLCSFLPGLLFLGWLEGAGAAMLAIDQLWPGSMLLSSQADAPSLTPLAEGIVVAGAISLAAAAPVLLARILPTVPLRSGRPVELMREICRIHRVRPIPLRLWRPSAGQANAMVMGMIPGSRAMLVSERLIEGMQEPLLGAVIGHEIGHVRRRHIPWLAAAVLATSMCMQWIIGEGIGAFTFMAIVAVVGLTSRRFEAQADLLAVESLERMGLTRDAACAAMIAALHRVAELNGISPSRRDFLHGSIEARITRLASIPRDPDVALRIHRKAAWIRAAIAAALIASAALWVFATHIQGDG
ncbi:MAG: M48 family metalloprotease [Phycisphaeraceae bacterium]|nr:M48 family metalloprotease [Phycisphaeraceae bacterium]